MAVLVPPVNTKGEFKFGAPFTTTTNSLIQEKQEFTVTAVRNLVELYNSNEEPLNTIYKPAGMTEAEYQADLDANIPIIVFRSSGGEYFYVPANRVLSIPKINGIKYQEKVLAISLGNIPLNMNLDIVKDIVVNDIQTTTGISSTVKVVPASAVILLDQTEHDTYTNIRNSAISETKSYRTKYLEALSIIEDRDTLITAMEQCMLGNCPEVP